MCSYAKKALKKEYSAFDLCQIPGHVSGKVGAGSCTLRRERDLKRWRSIECCGGILCNREIKDMAPGFPVSADEKEAVAIIKKLIIKINTPFFIPT